MAMTHDKGANKEKRQSAIFRDPDNLPSIKDVLREFQRLRKRGLRVSHNILDTAMDAREIDRDLTVRFTMKIKPVAGCGQDDDWCVICDGPKDNCSKCDAFDCIGCDAEEFGIDQEEIVSNPPPLIHEVRFRKFTAEQK
jgi:hypothetical protein